ncbi:hypothetical protein DFH06DRAFT_505709 [Mycena polygramma]|nr:hypothetical protein DFH06DRAFT_505709 [Mycena polygramma]
MCQHATDSPGTPRHQRRRRPPGSPKMTPTCALCRKRKLRCDGGQPCAPCSRTRTPVVCTYVPKTVGQLRSELPKGGACITCRQRKRRCDGQLPCRTCTQTSRPDECQYREKARSSHKPARTARAPREDQFSSDSGSTSSSSRPTTPSSQSASHTFGVLRLPNEYLEAPSPSDPPFSAWSELTSTCAPVYPAGSSCSISLPSLDTVAFPQPALEIDPLSEDREHMEKLVVRNLFLQHGWQYGLSVTTARRDALSIGDFSGITVDPTLVRVSELMGYLVRIHSHPEAWLPFNTQTAAESELDFLIRSALDSPGADPLLRLQGYTTLCLYSAQKEDIHSCQEFLVKASDVVLHRAAALGLDDEAATNLMSYPQFDASYLSPQSLADEGRAAFAQMFFLDMTCRLILNLPSAIDPALIEKFRRLAAVNCADTELNFMRAKSSLFLSDSQDLANAWTRREFGADPTPTTWSKRYWRLISDAHAHIALLNTVLMDVSWIPALQGALPTLKVSVIMALAALAELYGLFALSQPESRRGHRDAVRQIGDISRGFQEEEYEYLDPVLGVCWSIASRVVHSNAHDPNTRSEWDEGTLPCTMVREWNRKLRRVSPFVVTL